MIKVIKKDGSMVEFDGNKIKVAIRKSAERSMISLTEEQENKVVDLVYEDLIRMDMIEGHRVSVIHNLVEKALRQVDKDVAESYASYRNYKNDFVGMLDQVYKKAQSVLYVGDKENSNADSSLVSTKRSLITGELTKELYQRFFLTEAEKQACKDGFIYVHDMRDRMYTLNCCLADVSTIMAGGFEMGNIWYNEPKTVDTACDVLGDVIMSMASQQYGGYTVAEVDTVLAPYCEKSYNKYYQEYLDIATSNNVKLIDKTKADEYATKKVYRELEQGIQGLEIKLNTVASSRGDYPFTTFSFGIDKSKFGQMVSEVILKVRGDGQGKEGFKKSVLFPKLVFIYSDELHGKGKELEHLFDKAIKCSSKAMYPDYLSVDNGYTGEMYKKYGKVVSPMGA
jgi:ribonucleoside-triphosphate reductase